VITDAQDLNETNFACYTDMKGNVANNLTAIYDDYSKTMNITMRDVLNNEVNFFDLNNIYFGNSETDINLCKPANNFYKIKRGVVPFLGTPNVTLELESMTPNALRDLELKLSVLQNGMLNIHYTFKNFSDGVKVPFEMPQEIIDVDRSHLSSYQNLSDWVIITNDGLNPMKIEILGLGNFIELGQVVYTLNGIMLGEYINYLDGTAHTSNTTTDDVGFLGVMGLFEQVSDDLWLKDGVYS